MKQRKYFKLSILSASILALSLANISFASAAGGVAAGGGSLATSLGLTLIKMVWRGVQMPLTN